MDQTQNKAREIDLVAEKLWPVMDHWGQPMGDVAVRLFVECKFIPSYSVFWFADKDTEAALDAAEEINDAALSAIDELIVRYELPAHTVGFGVKGAAIWSPTPVRNYRDYKRTDFEAAELAVVGVPAVLVPLPIATRNHQEFNAGDLVRAGGATLIVDAELTVDSLEVALAPLVDSADVRARMSAAARSVGHPDAASRVANLVQEHARPS